MTTENRAVTQTWGTAPSPKPHSKRLLFVLAMALMLGLAGCAPSWREAEAYALGTRIACRISGSGTAMDVAWDALTQTENQMSLSLPQSQISLANAAQGQPTSVSLETARVLATGLELSRRSEGAFDMTVRPAMELWGLLPQNWEQALDTLPGQEAIEDALRRIGWEKVTLDGNTLTLADGAALDLGGIAKGYAGDQMAAALGEHGVKNGLLDLGGNIVALGTKAGKPWVVGIQDPRAPGKAALTLPVSDATVSTSGLWERYVEIDGQRYGHIIDPKTCAPVDNELLSVSVTGTEGILCDGLSTACFVLGFEKALPLLESYAMEGVFLFKDGTVAATPGLRGKATLAGTDWRWRE